MCYFIAVCWGFSDIILESNTDAMIAFSFNGKLQAFSVKITFFSAGAALTYLLNIIFSILNFPDYVFLFTVVLFQIATTAVGLNISEVAGYYDSKKDEEYEDLVEEGRESDRKKNNNKEYPVKQMEE